MLLKKKLIYKGDIEFKNIYKPVELVFTRGKDMSCFSCSKIYICSFSYVRYISLSEMCNKYISKGFHLHSIKTCY